MRADRLVQLLLFLQRRGKVTVAQVAEELEISPRTARRDLEALGMSGIPVYSQPGRGGGWQLIGGATTDLSGLTEAEVRALFVVAGGADGLDPQLRTALRKLTSALPEPFRAGAEMATQAIIVDPDSWGYTELANARPQHFNVISGALLAGRQMNMEYLSQKQQLTKRVVHPLGLIEKRGRWYMVCNTDSGIRTFRLDRVQSAEQNKDPVETPANFNLETEWERINHEFAEHTLTVKALVMVHDRRTLAALRGRFGRRLTELDEAPSNGTSPAIPSGEASADDSPVQVEIGAWSAQALAAEIASFVGLVRVESPKETIDTLRNIGNQLVAAYGAA